MNKKLTFIYGGKSDEHDISVKSFENVFNEASKAKNLEIDKIYIDKGGKWSQIHTPRGVYWPIIHGNFGEDGNIQKILEKKRLKFIGNSSGSSLLAFNKLKSQKLLQNAKILSPKTILLPRPGREISRKVLLKIEKLNFPIFVKPNKNGSSVGLLKIESKNKLKQKLLQQVRKFGSILIQELIEGREFTCGVVRIGKKLKTLVPTEIVLDKQEIFDYENKYSSKRNVEITPPENIDKKVVKQIQGLAKRCHIILGLRDYSRTDMILTKGGKLVFLETNSIPGMTEKSILPKQLSASGINMQKFIKICMSNYK